MPDVRRSVTYPARASTDRIWFGSPFSDEPVGRLADVVAEIDGRSDVDGVMLDYVRFPNSSEAFGYGPAADYGGSESEHERRVLAITEGQGDHRLGASLTARDPARLETARTLGNGDTLFAVGSERRVMR